MFEWWAWRTDDLIIQNENTAGSLLPADFIFLRTYTANAVSMRTRSTQVRSVRMVGMANRRRKLAYGCMIKTEDLYGERRIHENTEHAVRSVRMVGMANGKRQWRLSRKDDLIMQGREKRKLRDCEISL